MDTFVSRAGIPSTDTVGDGEPVVVPPSVCVESDHAIPLRKRGRAWYSRTPEVISQTHGTNDIDTPPLAVWFPD